MRRMSEHMSPDRSGSRAGKRRRRQGSPPEKRDWAELPRDVLSLLFQKLGAIEVLWPAQAVCRPWRQLALDRHVWRRVDVRCHADLYNEYDAETLAREAIDRSRGLVEEFYAKGFGSDELLSYIAERTTSLKCIVLVSAYNVSNRGMAKFVGQCPLLEELQISNGYVGDGAIGAIGRARPELKRFRLNRRDHNLRLWWSQSPSFGDDFEAHEIADNMPQLRELQLIGNHITEKGVGAILDKCLLLESLDIRACLHVTLGASLLSRLAGIRNVRLPHDSTADFELENGICPLYSRVTPSQLHLL